MAIKFKEIRASRIYTDNLLTAAGEPASTGSHSIAGTLSTSGNALIGGTFTSTGAATFSSTLGVVGNVAVNTNKFNVTAASGNTAVAGTLTVAGAAALNGGVTCDTDKFVVADTTGATTIKATLTVGVDDTGHDVKFYGATTGKYLLWDESADTLDIVGTTRTLGALRMTGETAGGVTVLFTDAAGDALLATHTSVPADAGSGFAKGCLFIDTNVGAGTSGLYVNIGTNTSCNFNLVSNASD